MDDTTNKAPSTTSDDLEPLTKEQEARINAVWAENKLGPPQTRDPNFWLTNPNSD